nr:unnamed protein product [Callosobruchus chinensis]
MELIKELRSSNGNNDLKKLSKNGRGEFLLNLIKPHITKKHTVMRQSISPEERLLLTLRFLASGDSYESLKFLIKIAPCPISKIVPQVCQAIITEVWKGEIKVSLVVGSFYLNQVDIAT